MAQVTMLIRGDPPKMGAFGLSHGATTPPPGPFGPNFGRLTLTAMPNVGAEVLSKFNIHGGRFGAFHVGIKHIPWTFPPPHL